MKTVAGSAKRSHVLAKFVGALTCLTLVLLGLPRAWAAGQEVELEFSISDSFASYQLSSYNPANPAEKREYQNEPGKKYFYGRIPAGWKLNGQIVMKPGRVITGTGSHRLTTQDFEMRREGEGNASYLVYTLKDFTQNPNDVGNIKLNAWQTQSFNYAEYHLNGGTWTDTTSLNVFGVDGLSQQPGRYHQIFIPPYGKVYKPTDPVREGYKFKGWAGTSALDPAHNTTPKRFTPDNPYQFDETDPNIAVGYVRGRIVRLIAVWEKIPPTIEVTDKTIYVGAEFDTKDLLTLAKDYQGQDITDSVTVTGTYRVDQPGTYPLTYTVTDKLGNTATKTANLIVEPKPDNPPVLDTEEIEVLTGDSLNLTSLYTQPAAGTQVFVDPNTTVNTAVAGTYPVNLIAINQDGFKTTKTVNVVVKDKYPAPTLAVQDMQITAGANFNPRSMVANSTGGMLTMSVDSSFDPSKTGKYEIIFVNTNPAGVRVEQKATLTVKAAQNDPTNCVCGPEAGRLNPNRPVKRQLPRTGSDGFGPFRLILQRFFADSIFAVPNTKEH